MVFKVWQKLFLKGKNKMVWKDILIDIVLAAEEEKDLIKFRRLHNVIQNAREELISEGYLNGEEEDIEESFEG